MGEEERPRAAIPGRYEAFQRDVDATSVADYRAFRAAGHDMAEGELSGALAGHPGLRRYDEAFDKVLGEFQSVSVTDAPAVWFLYNMGLVVKTPRVAFSVDVVHRQDARLAPLLDFALITHNHGDHWSGGFYQAMNGTGKTVVSNFLDNYGAQSCGNGCGGYVRGERTFEIGDVAIRTSLSDHNPYLVDFTTALEISVGGWTLYHSGDSSNIAKLNPTRRPDLWVVHPRCGLNVADGVRKFHPARVAICHLFELEHSPGKWRWRVSDGFEAVAGAEAAGAGASVPLWGDRIQ